MSEIFIGRQPILDRRLEIAAYELLYREHDGQNAANFIDGDRATSQVILHTLADIGLESLVNDKKAFINLTRYFFEDPDRIIFTPGQIVLEVLEDIEPDETVMTTLSTLKSQGHCIALDDFQYKASLQPLVDLADIIKIDVMALSAIELEQQLANYRDFSGQLLAEKVESYAEFESLKELGFDYFQGYFYAKPTIIKGKGLKTNQLSTLRLVAELSDPSLELDQLSNIISTNVPLCHKLLKFINSPVSGLRTQVESIKQAVLLLGMKTIKNWVALIALASASEKPNVLNNMATKRARTCEQLAKTSHLGNSDSFFTVGLFSALDAMMDQPLSDLIDELPLYDDMKRGLTTREGLYGEALNCAEAMEGNGMDNMSFLDLEINDMSDIHLEAISWSDQQAQAF